MNFTYAERPLWKLPLTFQICSGERIRIEGNNGTGKTTLIKLITNSLQPSTGNVVMADFRYLYIDQEYSILDSELSVFEQVQKFNNRYLLEHELKMLLHHHQFSRDIWDRKCKDLSGVEAKK